MPVEHIAQYRKIESELIEAIQDDNEGVIRKLDRELSGAFDQVVATHPQSSEELEKLMTFLLDLLINEGTRTRLEKQICDKIVKLS